MKKIFWLLLLMFSLTYSAEQKVVFKLSSAFHEKALGSGCGIQFEIDLNNSFQICPNFNCSYLQNTYRESKDRFQVTELDMNWDIKYFLLQNIITPYFGYGVAVPIEDFVLDGNKKEVLSYWGTNAIFGVRIKIDEVNFSIEAKSRIAHYNSNFLAIGFNF